MFMRFFGLVENFPLYAMVGIACGLAAYTPVRHLATASDIALDRSQRDYMDDLADKPRALERAKAYEGGVLGWVASFHNWPQVWPTPKSVPTGHFTHERWPAPRPFAVPQAPAN